MVHRHLVAACCAALCASTLCARAQQAPGALEVTASPAAKLLEIARRFGIAQTVLITGWERQATLKFQDRKGFRWEDMHRLLRAIEDDGLRIESLDLGRRDRGVGQDIWRPDRLDVRLLEKPGKGPVLGRVEAFAHAIEVARDQYPSLEVNELRVDPRFVVWDMSFAKDEPMGLPALLERTLRSEMDAGRGLALKYGMMVTEKDRIVCKRCRLDIVSTTTMLLDLVGDAGVARSFEETEQGVTFTLQTSSAAKLLELCEQAKALFGADGYTVLDLSRSPDHNTARIRIALP